jgi:hypothetical protein
MVGERGSRTAVHCSAVRTIAAFAVAACMLLQLVLAAPLAMRVPASFYLAGWPVELCAMRSAGGTTDPAREPRPPVSPHGHYGCPICQNHAVPMGILAGEMLLFIVATKWWRWLRPAVTTLLPTRPFRLYSPRAPPALA